MSSKIRLMAGSFLPLLLVSPLFAAGGTDSVAIEGRQAHVPESWPDGAGEIVNDPARTEGWNSWFTEWPSDVNQYAFPGRISGRRESADRKARGSRFPA